MPPEGAKAPEDKAGPKQEGAPPKPSEPLPGLGGLKMVAFSESLTESKPKAADDRKEPPIKKEAPATGSGLLQFPKLDPSARKKDDDSDPFALPTGQRLKTFGKEPVEPVKPPPAQPPRLPAAKPVDKLPEAKPAGKPPEAKPAEKLPELRPEDRRPEDDAAPTAKPERRPNPDFLKDLPRERAEEPRQESKLFEPPKAPAQAKAPAEPKAPPKGYLAGSEAEPPKTIIRVSRPAARDDAPLKADSKPPRKLEQPAQKAPVAEEAAGKKAASPLLWVGAAVGLVAVGAGGALLLTPRHGAGLSAKPAAQAPAVYAPPAPVAAATPAPPAPAAPAGAETPTPAVVPSQAAAAPAQPAPAAARPSPAPAVAAAPPAAPPPTPAAAPAGTAGDRAGTVVLLKAPTLPPELLAKKKVHVARWVFEGRVYDLIALNNVAGAKLTLTGPNGQVAAETTTAEDGQYKLSVDPLSSGGYTLTMSADGYTGRFLDDINPPFEQAPRQARLLAAQGSGSKPFIGDAGHVVKRTLVAIPTNTDE